MGPKIIPALDLLDGQVVRLKRGIKETAHVYSTCPADYIKSLALNNNFDRIHIVDLNQAFGLKSNHKKIFLNLESHILKKIEISGGIRSQADIEDYQSMGLTQFMIGTWACKIIQNQSDPPKLLSNSKLRLALDVKGDLIYQKGWTENSGIKLSTILKLNFIQESAGIMLTSIERDGLNEGPDFDLYKNILKINPDLNIISSGGLRDLEDVQKLYNIGVKEMIVGKAWLENPSAWGIKL